MASRTAAGRRMKPTRLYTFHELIEPVFLSLREYLADGLGKPFLPRGVPSP